MIFQCWKDEWEEVEVITSLAAKALPPPRVKHERQGQLRLRLSDASTGINQVRH
jgi:hypothetical protein